MLTSPNAVLPEFSDLAYGLGSLWIVNRAANVVTEVDTATIQRQNDITVGNSPTAIAVSPPDSLWVANFEDDTLTRIVFPGRGKTPTLTTIAVGDGPIDVTFGEGSVWVVSSLDRKLMRIDPESGEVRRRSGSATSRSASPPARAASG